MAISSTDKSEIKSIARREMKAFMDSTQAHNVVIRVIQKELGTRRIDDKIVDLSTKVVVELFKGGLADKKTIEDVARKHSQFVGTISLALAKGIKVETEHTDDKESQKEIAMDHLWEDHEYYDKLEKVESKEQTMAGSSGSYVAPMSMPVMKRDIQNFKLKPKQKEFDEATTAGVSAGAMYDAPIGHKQKDPLALDNVSANESASITAASSKDMIATKKGFPRFGGPDAKFVEIKDKCKTYPYCNQMSGLDNLILKEIHGMKDAIVEAAKKYGITVKQVEEILIKESKQISAIN